MAKFCRSQWCQNFNKELSDDQVEFSPDRGVHYCKQCFMDVEVTADTGVPKPPTQGKPTLLRPAPSPGTKEQPTIFRPIVRPPPPPPPPEEPEREKEKRPPEKEPRPIQMEGARSFPVLELWYHQDRRGQMEMQGDELLIGRPSTSRDIHPDLDLSDLAERKEISREHALIYQDEGNYFLKDLGSKNGTYLNDAKLEPNVPHLLKEGDRITISDGIYGIIFHWQGG